MFFFGGLRRAIGLTPAALFPVVLMSLTDIWRIWPITTHFLSMALILAGAGLFARVHVKYRDLSIAIVLAAVLGALFNFVDFLINPPMMPMLLAFVVMAVALADTPQVRRQSVVPSLAAAGLTAAGCSAATPSPVFELGPFGLGFGRPGEDGERLSSIESCCAFTAGNRFADHGGSVVADPQMIGQSFLSSGSITGRHSGRRVVPPCARDNWARFELKRFSCWFRRRVVPTLWFNC